MPAKAKTQVADTIESCEHARANDWPYVCAVDLSDFLTAQEHGLVTAELRAKLDVEALTAYVLSRKGEIETSWDRERQQLERIVSHGRGLEYEEVVLVLTLRSSLEAACRFLQEDRRRQLREEVDEPLEQILRGNLAIVTKLQRRGSYGVDSRLPGRWWWQEGLPRERS
jgi:hypothetical protein